MNIRRNIIILILIIAAVGVYWYFLRTDDMRSPGGGNTPGNLPDGGTPPIPGTGGGSIGNGIGGNAGPFPIPTGDTLLVESQQGESISVRNFYNDSATAITEEGIPFLHDQPSTYTLLYVPLDKSFTVSINTDSNIPLIRAEMESDLLAFLGISSQKACELKIHVGIPAHVSTKYIAKNLGLSFCPTGTPL
jgi:hypothetical protein